MCQIVCLLLIEKQWPHIFFTRCTCHCLDLLLEDIGKLSWVSPVLDIAKSIVRFITRKPTLLAMYRRYIKKKLLKISIRICKNIERK